MKYYITVSMKKFQLHLPTLDQSQKQYFEWKNQAQSVHCMTFYTDQKYSKLIYNFRRLDISYKWGTIEGDLEGASGIKVQPLDWANYSVNFQLLGIKYALHYDLCTVLFLFFKKCM